MRKNTDQKNYEYRQFLHSISSLNYLSMRDLPIFFKKFLYPLYLDDPTPILMTQVLISWKKLLKRLQSKFCAKSSFHSKYISFILIKLEKVFWVNDVNITY